MSTRFVIAGREYDPRSALRASLNIWRRVLLEQGVGMKTVLGHVGEIKDTGDILEDPAIQKSFMAYLWVLRLVAGEDVTFEEANDVPLDEIRMVSDDEEPEDPKAPVDSEQDDAPRE